MKKMFYHGPMRLIVIVTFVVTGSVMVPAQRFETHKVYLSNNVDLTRTIKINPANKFSIKKDNRFSWVQYEEQNAAVKISVTANTSHNNRSCSLVLLNEAEMPVDTLEVIQTGTVSTTVSKIVGTSTRTSTKKSSSTSSRSIGGQCAARTKKGTRCSRRASAGSIYCWQHNK